MYTELTAGYHVNPERLITGAIFDIAYSEMVVVKDIPFLLSTGRRTRRGCGLSSGTARGPTTWS